MPLLRYFLISDFHIEEISIGKRNQLIARRKTFKINHLASFATLDLAKYTKHEKYQNEE